MLPTRICRAQLDPLARQNARRATYLDGGENTMCSRGEPPPEEGVRGLGNRGKLPPLSKWMVSSFGLTIHCGLLG